MCTIPYSFRFVKAIKEIENTSNRIKLQPNKVWVIISYYFLKTYRILVKTKFNELSMTWVFHFPYSLLLNLFYSVLHLQEKIFLLYPSAMN